MAYDRVLSVREHDDGANSWRMAEVSAPPELRNEIYGYSDYRERTGGFTVRRELPHAEGVLIVNLGAPIAITGGDGRMLQLKAGDSFAAGAHLRPALSHSEGSQAGMHVFLPLATLRRLLAMPMDRLVDRVIPLDTLLLMRAILAQNCAVRRTAPQGSRCSMPHLSAASHRLHRSRRSRRTHSNCCARTRTEISPMLRGISAGAGSILLHASRTPSV